MKTNLHQNICGQASQTSTWFCEKAKQLSYPIYSSYDIRDAGFKISNVDANIFPAGFNNICPTDKDAAVGIMDQYLTKHYGSRVEKILLVTEEHTQNPFYWENVSTLQQTLVGAGKQVLIGIPKRLSEPLVVKSSSGQEIKVISAFEDSPEVQEFKPDLVISNNDFSESNEDWASYLTLPMNPPRELGWYQRKKSRYFENYNQLVGEFAKIVGFDPFLMNVKTEVYENFDINEEASRVELASRVDRVLAELKEDYLQRGIQQEPFVFVKNNSGTYGLAVVRVGSGAEVRDWNYKSRKKMKAAKGGRDVEEIIVQEGIPSRVQSDGASAEPVIYMIGSELAGGFLRTHAEKSNTDSLNSPGAVYKKLCVSDLNVSLQGSPLENVYGWSARLGLLAIGMEAEQMKIQFAGYQKASQTGS
ncbi:MAG: glutamate--cysteine ligase [Bdellovibrio sp. CG10_big_fil_rev_8_21_14_0_10_47_8]|nr:MAG: glutamate--cysteine ligase [Bdellovibrio sp. CG10_big_fil_rev_8_21_14_0_10_47_8]